MTYGRSSFRQYKLSAADFDVPPSLNTGQKAAYRQILEFILDQGDMEGENYLGLVSGPGCGKTFVLGTLYAHLPKVVQENIHFTATTNKAAQELKSSIVEHTKREMKFVDDESDEDASYADLVTTIYKKLNLYLKGPRKSLEQRKPPEFDFGSVLVIDESSFINEPLLRYILAATDGRVKVIFVGDKNQLCPVGLDYTPVYDKTFRRLAGRKVDYPILELTQIMRQTKPESEIVSYCKALKAFIAEERDDLPMLEPSEEIKRVSQAEFEKLMLDAYLKGDSFKVLAQTNSKVNRYNGLINLKIREDRYLRVGDMATVNTRTEEFFTDETVTVLASDECVKSFKLEYYNKELDKVFRKEWPDLKGRQIKVDNGVQSASYFVPYTLGKTREIVDIDSNMILGVADLRAVHACTVHKSQGSTYNTVFLDLGSFSEMINDFDLARLLYVAVSRAKSQVYVTGSHPRVLV